MNLFHLSPKAVYVTLAGASLVLTTAAHAQQANPPPATATAAPEETFSYELGRAATERGAAGGSQYAVAATRDYSSKEKGGKLRLSVVEKDSAGSMTHLMTVNAGKYKTVSQLSSVLADIFRKYLAAEAANQEIGKIGDLAQGGEIRFYAESRELFRYDWQVPGEPPHPTRFKRADIEVFLGILTHPKAAAN